MRTSYAADVSGFGDGSAKLSNLTWAPVGDGILLCNMGFAKNLSGDKTQIPSVKS